MYSASVGFTSGACPPIARCSFRKSTLAGVFPCTSARMYRASIAEARRMLEVDSNGSPSIVPPYVLNDGGEFGTKKDPPLDTEMAPAAPCGTRGSFRFSNGVPDTDTHAPPAEMNSQNGLPVRRVSPDELPCR